MTETGIFTRLKADHDRHRELLDKIDATQGDSDERRDLFEAFRIDVTAHAASEEMSLYATMLANRSEEHTSELQSLMRISYAVFCLKKKIHIIQYKDCTHN